MSFFSSPPVVPTAFRAHRMGDAPAHPGFLQLCGKDKSAELVAFLRPLFLRPSSHWVEGAWMEPTNWTDTFVVLFSEASTCGMIITEKTDDWGFQGAWFVEGPSPGAALASIPRDNLRFEWSGDGSIVIKATA